MTPTAADHSPSSVPFLPPVFVETSGGRPDPLKKDDLDDRAVVTTERRLLRLAIAAADTGARFGREGVLHDPVAWLLSPREVFHGRCAIDACQDLAPFLRSTLLHNLSLGLDADPVDLDELINDAADGAETADRAPRRPANGKSHWH